jgi:ribosomal protein S18 acetylase RimI-like enzyme
MTVASRASTALIRPAVAADADGIVSAFLDSAAHHVHLDPERYRIPPIEMIRARYDDRLATAAGPRTILVAELNGEVVGFIEAALEASPDPMHRDMTYCHVVEIAVQREHRRHGIGARLLAAAEAWGFRQGATFASLEYHIANTGAGAFYRKRMGYGSAAITAIKRLRSAP